MRTREATTYVVLEKGANWHKSLLVKRITSKRPALSAQQIAVKLDISVPANIFDELLPVVSIEIPAGMALAPVVSIEVADAGDE